MLLEKKRLTLNCNHYSIEDLFAKATTLEKTAPNNHTPSKRVAQVPVKDSNRSRLIYSSVLMISLVAVIGVGYAIQKAYF